MEDWTEKYRPKTLHEVIGNERAITALRSWARQWNNQKPPKKRAVILSGKPGTGKTSSALALAYELGWTPLELNASDARNATMIKRVATSGAIHETFDSQGRFLSSKGGGRKLIILDEADNLYEKAEKSDDESDFSDRGGKKAILETIRMTCQPMVLIVNDFYGLVKGGGEGFKTLCEIIPFYEVNAYQIVELLKRICREENIAADGKLLQLVADRSKGDVRSAVNDMQSLCVDRKTVDIQSLDVLGYRDRDKIIFDALRDVFKTGSISESRRVLDGVDVEPETFLLWVAENLPREYRAVDDLAKGYDMVAKADVFFGRVYKRQYYGLWSYACDLMCGGVTAAKTHAYGPVQYAAPQWMREMKQTKPSREIRDTISAKIGQLCRCSKKKSKEDLLPQFRQLFHLDIGFACRMKNKLDLSEGEIKYLLGEQHIQKLKTILEYCGDSDETQTMLEAADLPQKKQREEEKPQIETDVKQPSLFDF